MNNLTFYEQVKLKLLNDVPELTTYGYLVQFGSPQQLTQYVMLNIINEPRHSSESNNNWFALQISLADVDYSRLHEVSALCRAALHGMYQLDNDALVLSVCDGVSDAIPRNIGSREFVVDPGVYYAMFIADAIVEDM